MNRNIVTTGDLRNVEPSSGSAALPRTFAASPPGGVAGVGLAVQTQDDFLTKLVKYVPPEILGIYLFVASVVDTNVTNRSDHAIWMLCLLVVLGSLIVPYSRIVLNVVRPAQITVSVLGFALYVFALGGWFATTTWYHAWYASIALPAFGLIVAFLRLKPLPLEPDS